MYQTIIRQHRLWLMSDPTTGKRANFRCAYLPSTDFTNTDLRQANFTVSDTQDADFRGADLTDAINPPHITTGEQHMIKSVNDNQHQILLDIMQLCGIEQFEADISYGNGSFYNKGVPEPGHKFDIDPQQSDTKQAHSGDLPVESKSLSSVVFDPPFLTYVKQAREHNSIMGKRFGGYWRYDELEMHYKSTLIECHRVLQEKGILVFKCQDIIHNHKMHCTHLNVVEWAKGMFRLKDMFILTAKHRMPMPKTAGAADRKQQHARIHHSYFLVLENNT